MTRSQHHMSPGEKDRYIKDLEENLEEARRAPVQVIIDHLEGKHQQEMKTINAELQLTKKRVSELEQQLKDAGIEPIESTAFRFHWQR